MPIERNEPLQPPSDCTPSPYGKPGGTCAALPGGDLAPTEAPRGGPACEGGSVRRITPFEDPQWDARLDTRDPSAFFRGTCWANVLRDSYGFTPAYFASEGNGVDPSLLAFMEVDSRLTGRRGVSLPFADECEPVAADAGRFKALFEAAIEYGRSRQWRYLELRGGRIHLPEAGASCTFHGHRLGLRRSESELFHGFYPAVRRAIRTAERSGLQIEFAQTMDAVRCFYDLLCRTRKRQGVPPQPFHFFANIQRHVLETGHGWVVLARHDGLPVAGSVIFLSGKTVTYKYGASIESHLRMRPNNLIMWEVIRRHADAGYDVLDFGRTSLANTGLRRFKLGWGSTERTIDYLRLDLESGRYLSVGDRSTGWQSTILRTLPSPANRLIGSLLYKHVA